MAKLVLDDVSNLYGNTTGAENKLNNNSAKIEAAIEDTLSRSGKAPNQMNADLDMNSNRIINVADGVDPTDAVTVQQLQSAGTPTLELNDLTDVSVSGAETGDRLVYDNGSWTAKSASEVGGVSVLDDLLDVNITALNDEHALVYNAVAGEWQNTALPSGVTTHGALNGLSNDDHPQYLTLVRGQTYFPSINVTITGTNSLTGGGNLTVNRTISLLNDQASPGASRYYGTNSSGAKGWYALPSQIVDHGGLVGLSDDDHPQYLNTTRASALYSPISHTHTQYADKTAAQTITGAWSFTTVPYVTSAGPILYHANAGYTSSKITVSSSPPSGGQNGDIWFVVAA